MNKLNTFFFILLLSTFIFCSKNNNVLEMIENQKEGKEVLELLNLQIKMKGPVLNQGDLYKLLKFVREQADAQRAQETADAKATAEQCKNDIPSFQKKVNNNLRTQFTIQRHLSNNKRGVKRVGSFISRTQNEKNDYEVLINLVSNGWEKWKQFHESTLSELNKIIGLLKKARKHLKDLHSNEQSLVELNSNHKYFTGLSEIKSNFQNSQVNLEGFRPVITKLLQIMQKPNAVSQGVVRERLISLFKKIASQLAHRRDEIELVRERQNAIFTSVLESYKENLAKLSKLLERLSKEKSELSSREKSLVDSRNTAANVVRLSKEVYVAVKTTCLDEVKRISELNVSYHKTLSVVATLNELLTEKFGALKFYFIQKASKDQNNI